MTLKLIKIRLTNWLCLVFIYIHHINVFQIMYVLCCNIAKSAKFKLQWDLNYK